MTKITIGHDEGCWICGSKMSLTTHHALPQHLKPKSNVMIPICAKCHSDIHAGSALDIEKHNTKLLSNLLEKVNKLTKLYYSWKQNGMRTKESDRHGSDEAVR